ncbi:hypothetical protein TSAR_003100 [Trichomalopsis sarcophagae]|uniref:Reverse transcriptase domain-containing protein n=1 Tax=Trichomalopsis sarcophagae TaxID=543379 RepID=A0A232ES06_9HYME|nr:hypothetical protein TSAR_003100 [Trichomalopsis sarcophagae]
MEENEEDSTETRWKDTKEIIKKAWIVEERRVKERKLGFRRWWNRDCTRMKWGAKKEYKKWKKGEKKQWKTHFEKLLQGSGTKKLGEKREMIGEKKEGEGITAEEILQAWKDLKKRKAPGWDEIPNEAWIHGSQEIKEKLVAIIGKIWDGEEIPEDWKTGVIVQIYKKGNVNESGNYRGITLLPTTYKIYAEVLRKILVKEVEEKGLEGGVRTVNRKKLWKILEDIGISKYIVEQLKGIYEEPRVRVRTEGGVTEDFWTELGLRQGCVLSPILFCFYIRD